MKFTTRWKHGLLRAKFHPSEDSAYDYASVISLFVAVCMLIFSGCGPSQEVIDAQDQQIQQEYEQAAKMPPNMPPHLQERRQWRLEQEFGDRPAVEDAGAQEAAGSN